MATGRWGIDVFGQSPWGGGTVDEPAGLPVILPDRWGSAGRPGGRFPVDRGSVISMSTRDSGDLSGVIRRHWAKAIPNSVKGTS